MQASDDGIESKGLLSSSWWAHSDDPVEEDKPAVQTLVLYIFSNTDPEYIDNLRYYVRTAIQEDDGCQHVIVVNSGEDSPVRLPTIAWIIQPGSRKNCIGGCRLRGV